MGEELQKYLADGMKEIRELVIANTAEIRELKGELREFKGHVLGRVEKLETKETEQAKKTLSVLSLLISGTALAVSVIVNFFRNGGK
jgi:hypothetical protein